MGRAASPALSENEFDISKSLFGGGDDNDLSSDSESEHISVQKSKSLPAVDLAGSDDEDEAFITAAQAAVNRKGDGKSKKSGAFQSMGLNTHLLKAIARKGFSVPTPIQRKTIPLILDGQDVVGMARTGSGKTAAFVIPMIEKLKSHSAKVGARAIVLSPSRELALQTLKVVKEMSRGTDLRTTLLVGGDSLEEQFSSMASNPDIIIATPGRFEHLKVEMGLELSSVKYVVFDEADRLFEMGFAAQLLEIMHSLPSNRQTLLFSATLPKSLVEFARAGLQDPKLVRLDAESKIAPGLQSAFFTVKRADKEGALLHILQDVVKMPTGETAASIKAKEAQNQDSKKRKRGNDNQREMPSEHSTVIFAATKHHVDYLASFLKAYGYATSYVYGSLDQTARKMQVLDFRTGMTNILVVTDVAARGLDIPILANVINYDFPSQPKIFVHRVGRTARAGKEGCAYSLVTNQDMPYLLDLQLFLGRKLLVGRVEKEREMFQNSIVVGSMQRAKMESLCEEAQKLLDDDDDLRLQRDVAGKGEKQYMRTRNSASAESVKRAKGIAQEDSTGVNVLFDDGNDAGLEKQRLDMLARVSGFRPVETVFEVGQRGKGNEANQMMKNRRAKIEPKNQIAKQTEDDENSNDAPVRNPDADDDGILDEDSEEELVLTQPNGGANMSEASDSELELTFTTPADEALQPRKSKKHKSNWQDSEHFMSYTPSTLNLAEDRGYGVHSGGTNAARDAGAGGAHFLEAARGATMDLANDESKSSQDATKAKGMRWDKKSKKYVARANDEDGSKGVKYIKGESGQKIAASFKSGRFDAWRKANRVERMPRVGELESSTSRGGRGGIIGGGKRFKHKQELAPKAADKYRDDYETRKKKVEAAKQEGRGRFAKEFVGKNELRGAEDVRKIRVEKEKRMGKNARPQHKGLGGASRGGGRGGRGGGRGGRGGGRGGR